jgi:hypothetical protein
MAKNMSYYKCLGELWFADTHLPIDLIWQNSQKPSSQLAKWWLTHGSEKATRMVSKSGRNLESEPGL